MCEPEATLFKIAMVVTLAMSTISFWMKGWSLFMAPLAGLGVTVAFGAFALGCIWLDAVFSERAEKKKDRHINSMIASIQAKKPGFDFPGDEVDNIGVRNKAGGVDYVDRVYPNTRKKQEAITRHIIAENPGVDEKGEYAAYKAMGGIRKYYRPSACLPKDPS